MADTTQVASGVDDVKFITSIIGLVVVVIGGWVAYLRMMKGSSRTISKDYDVTDELDKLREEISRLSQAVKALEASGDFSSAEIKELKEDIKNLESNLTSITHTLIRHFTNAQDPK